MADPRPQTFGFATIVSNLVISIQLNRLALLRAPQSPQIWTGAARMVRHDRESGSSFRKASGNALVYGDA
jgi:hypothetical protein